MSSHTFDKLSRVIGKTISGITVFEPMAGADYLHVNFTDGTQLIVRSSEWFEDMELTEPSHILTDADYPLGERVGG